MEPYFPLVTLLHPIPKDIIPENATDPQPQFHPSPKDISLRGDFLSWGIPLLPVGKFISLGKNTLQGGHFGHFHDMYIMYMLYKILNFFE